MEKYAQIEVLETLASICLYLEREGRHSHNFYAQHMASHFEGLKYYSKILRKEIAGDNNADR